MARVQGTVASSVLNAVLLYSDLHTDVLARRTAGDPLANICPLSFTRLFSFLPSHTQLNDEAHFFFLQGQHAPSSEQKRALSLTAQSRMWVSLRKPRASAGLRTKPEWNERRLPLPPPATASVYKIRVNPEMGINCLGKYICNILTIFIHSFYCDIYYRNFRVGFPLAQTQTCPALSAPFPPAAGWPGRRAPLITPGNRSVHGRDFTANDRGRQLFLIYFSSC